MHVKPHEAAVGHDDEAGRVRTIRRKSRKDKLKYLVENMKNNTIDKFMASVISFYDFDFEQF